MNEVNAIIRRRMNQSSLCHMRTCLSLLQGIFLTQESNQGLLHCRKILYQLRYQGSTARKQPPANQERSLIGHQTYDILILDFPASRTKRNRCVFLSPSVYVTFLQKPNLRQSPFLNSLSASHFNLQIKANMTAGEATCFLSKALYLRERGVFSLLFLICLFFWSSHFP